MQARQIATPSPVNRDLHHRSVELSTVIATLPVSTDVTVTSARSTSILYRCRSVHMIVNMAGTESEMQDSGRNLALRQGKLQLQHRVVVFRDPGPLGDSPAHNPCDASPCDHQWSCVPHLPWHTAVHHEVLQLLVSR